MVNQRRKTKKAKRFGALLTCLCCVLALLLFAEIGLWWFLSRQGLAESVTVEAGNTQPHAGAYILYDLGFRAEYASDMSEIDLHRPGEYPVQIRYLGHVSQVTLKVVDTVLPKAEAIPLTAHAVRLPEPADFIRNLKDETEVKVTYVQQPDKTKNGEQTVRLLLTDAGGNTCELETVLTLIVDTEAPVLTGVKPLCIYKGQTPDYLSGVEVVDTLDSAPVLTVDDRMVDLSRGGEYTVTYMAEDASGNQTVQTTVLTVLVDDIAPTIMGVNPISLYMGSTVSYRKGIVVTDDQDTDLVFTVDSSQVDLSREGTYTLVYQAVDDAGNETRLTTTVTVKEKPKTYVDEQTIIAAADKILGEVITDGMTNRQKAEAVFRWIKRNFIYNNISDKTDYLQAAYTLMQKKSGDCFSYYAFCRLMFERLGFPHITVTRVENTQRPGRHWWSMISLDGGETWYHFDATPRPPDYTGDRFFCCVTDDFLAKFEKLYPGYYLRDMNLCPTTPAE